MLHMQQYISYDLVYVLYNKCTILVIQTAYELVNKVHKPARRREGSTLQGGGKEAPCKEDGRKHL